MSMLQLIREEIKRGPLALIFNAVMTAIALVGLWIALRQPVPTSVVSAAVTQGVPSKSSYAIWLTIAVYLSVTGVGASTSRLLYRANAWVALLSSLVLAVLSLFLTTWAAQRLGLDVSQSGPGQAFANLIFYGTLVIYLAVIGGKALLDFVRATHPAKATSDADSGTEAMATLASLGIAIAVWGWVVGAGQTAAVKAFL